MTAQVLIFDVRGPQYRALLAKRFPAVQFHIGHHVEDVEDIIAGIHVIFGLGHHIPPTLIAKAKNLKWVQALTTGTETLTAPGVLPPDVLLTSTRGIHGPQMSELAFLNMVALARNFKKNLLNQSQAKWDQWGMPILEGKTIVIVGLGLLAEHLAERCKLFGMTVVGVSNGRAGAPHFDEVHPRGELQKLAARADFLMLLVPYSEQTHHLIDRGVIAAMKPTAFLINLARGGIVEEDSMIEALNAGKIAGAALDVFQTEPLPPEHPLWSTKNVIITPHLGGFCDVYAERALPTIEHNMDCFLRGDIDGMVNLVRK